MPVSSLPFPFKTYELVTKGRLGLAKESRAQSLPLRLQVHTKTNTENNEKKSKTMYVVMCDQLQLIDTNGKITVLL